MYLGSSKFWEIVKFLENLGYELIDLKKINVASYFKYKINSNKIPNECDATFILNQKNIYSLDIEKKILILSFFISYNLIEEAIIFIENNNELKKFFDEKKYGYSKFLRPILFVGYSKVILIHLTQKSLRKNLKGIYFSI